MIQVVRHTDAAEFLARAEPWLAEREDEHNLILGLCYARAEGGVETNSDFYATIESAGAVLGCAMRTPPHKVLVTDLPTNAGSALAAELVAQYDEIPAVLGPEWSAESVAMAWVSIRGGGWRPGMEQRMYRLDTVTPPIGVSGSLVTAVEADVDLAVEWAEGFAKDLGVQFATSRASVEGWIEHKRLSLWTDDGRPVCSAVAQGRTARGVRVGYVYTPPEYRRRGYASACVAAVSQRALDLGASFCVLYTDLSNTTSNAIYQRIGYRPLTDIRDFDLVSEDAL
jgi:uncharacterized protein